MKSINLLPSNKKTSIGRLVPIIMLFAGAIPAFILVFYSMSWNESSKELEQELHTLAQEAEQLRKDGFPKEKYEAYNQALGRLKQIKSERKDWVPYLQSMIEPIGAGANVIALSLNGGSAVSLEIDFPSFDQYISYIKSLESNNRLDNIRISSYSTNAENDRTWQTADDNNKMPKRQSSYKALLELWLADQEGASSHEN